MIKRIHEIYYITKYDLKVFFRYKSNIVWLIATPIIYAIVGAILYNVMGGERFFELSGGTSSASLYTLVGYAVFSFSNFCLQAGQKIESEMVVGSLKTNFLLPIHRTSYVYGLSISTLCSTGIFSFIIFIVAMIFTRPSKGNLLFFFFALLISLTYFLGIALVMCSISLRLKKVGNLANLLTFLLQIITGMIIPITALPRYIKYICYLSPTTWSIDCIRSCLLGTDSITDSYVELGILVLVAIVSNILGSVLFRNAEKYINNSGEIEGY